MPNKGVVLGGLALLLGGCSSPDGAYLNGNKTDDIVIVLNQQGSDPVKVLLHGRVKLGPDCFRKSASGVGKLMVGNFIEAIGCHPEVALFSMKNGLYYKRDPKWGNDPGDEYEAGLRGRYGMPIKSWVLKGPFANKEAFALASLNRAEQIFNEAGCGIRIEDKSVEDLTALDDAEDFWDLKCSEIPELAARQWYKEGVLNVYFVKDADGRGEYCPETNAVLVSENADGETLGHELGHKMKLEDTQFVLPESNIMAGGENRSAATRGQCFRANLEPDSLFYKLGRGGLSRSCKSYAADPYGCPSISF